MQVLSLIWGILSIAAVALAFLPCVGALNWVVIPFAGLGFLISVFAFVGSSGEERGGSAAGMACCGLAALFGIFRLVLGGGIF
jgi:hypothetical protein